MRRAVRYPSASDFSVCLPGGSVSMHGALQLLCGLSSTTILAPAGSVTNCTDLATGAAGVSGCRGGAGVVCGGGASRGGGVAAAVAGFGFAAGMGVGEGSACFVVCCWLS